MEKLSLRQIQLRELELLAAFYDYCRVHSLRCYLVGGSLLGAIRHEGFIPWDDDVDVCMPRPDYEKLLDLTVRQGLQPEGFPDSFYLQSPDNGFIRPYARVFDLKTVVEHSFSNEYSIKCLFLDILVIDGLPENERDLNRLFRKKDWYFWLLRLRGAKILSGKTALRALLKAPLIPFARLRSAGWYVEKLDGLGDEYPYEKSNYVGLLAGALYSPSGGRMKKTEFECSVPVAFEGRTFETFACWDKYLTGCFGDYTVPVREGYASHILSAWVIDDTSSIPSF